MCRFILKPNSRIHRSSNIQGCTFHPKILTVKQLLQYIPGPLVIPNQHDGHISKDEEQFCQQLRLIQPMHKLANKRKVKSQEEALFNEVHVLHIYYPFCKVLLCNSLKKKTTCTLYQGVEKYCIYSIKCPDVYFLSRGAYRPFARDRVCQRPPFIHHNKSTPSPIN